MSKTAILLAVIGGISIYVIYIYNQLVALRNRFKNGFAQIDVQLQRRHDLIPNLVETAKAYMTHERETLESVIAARDSANTAIREAAKHPEIARNIDKLSSAENSLSRALANFYAVSENYPDLKADQTIQQLMEELNSTENRVGFARQAYNDFVMNYHTYREQFPNNFVAGFFSFKPTSLLELEDPEARKAVRVSFD